MHNRVVSYQFEKEFVLAYLVYYWANQFTTHYFNLLMKINLVINDNSLVFGATDYIYWSSVLEWFKWEICALVRLGGTITIMLLGLSDGQLIYAAPQIEVM